jgi:hypothetical protein
MIIVHQETPKQVTKRNFCILTFLNRDKLTMIQGPHLIIAYKGPPNKSENQNIVNELYSTLLVGNIFLNVVLPWIRNLWMSFHCFHPSPTIGMM